MALIKKMEPLRNGADREEVGVTNFEELIGEKKYSERLVDGYKSSKGVYKVQHDVGKAWGSIRVPIRGTLEEVSSSKFGYAINLTSF